MWRLKGGEEGNSFLSAATISKTTSGFRSIPISLHERYYPVLCCAMLGWAGLGCAGLQRVDLLIGLYTIQQLHVLAVSCLRGGCVDTTSINWGERVYLAAARRAGQGRV